MNFPFLNKFFRGPVLGLDIGQSGVKLVRLHSRPEKTEADCHYYPERILAGTNQDVEAFRRFLQSQHLLGMSVAVNIEDASLKIRRVDVPKMPADDLREAVPWLLRDVVEGPISDYVVRHSLIEESVAGDVRRLSLVAYAIRKKTVHDRVGFLTRCGLKPVFVEPASVSLLALFDRLHGWKQGECCALIDLGESKSIFTVMSEGRLFFSRPLPGISLSLLRSQVEKELSLTPAEAELLLKNVEREGEKLDPILSSFYSRLAVETQRSVDGFSLVFKKERNESQGDIVSRIFL